MTKVTPIVRHKKVLKHKKKFKRYQSDNFMRVGESWRAPRGIDGRFRRRFKGTPMVPKIGYGTAKEHKHLLPSGFKKFRVYNPEDVDVLLMSNREYAAEIGAGVGIKKRAAIIQRCVELNVKVTNARGKLASRFEDYE